MQAWSALAADEAAFDELDAGAIIATLCTVPVYSRAGHASPCPVTG